MSSQLTADLLETGVPLGHDSRSKLDLVLKEVVDSVAPVWPLKDYVAVNPYLGLSERSFMSARTFLRVFSDCEMLMPLEYYAAQWRSGQLESCDVQQALVEVGWPQAVPRPGVQDVFRLLRQSEPTQASLAEANLAPRSRSGSRPIRSVIEHASDVSSTNWHEIVTDEISKFCAAHYDDGQATWGSGWKQASLYTAWHEMAQIDRNAEILGIRGMRKLVASLPQDPTAAVGELLWRSKIPSSLWSAVLLCQVFAMPGWFAWAKYQDEQRSGDEAAQAFIGLLAIRLAYDLGVGQAVGLSVDWSSYLRNGYASFQGESAERVENAWVRYVLLHASEIRYRRQLLAGIASSAAPSAEKAAPARPSAQMVFCIDVRSERMRRNLESICPTMETFGFAGFFGLPIEFLPLGETQATAQLPVLLKPQHCVRECVTPATSRQHAHILQRRSEVRWWRKLWSAFQSLPISSFGFVESSGLWGGWQLLRQTLGLSRSSQHQLDGLGGHHHQLRPALTSDAPEALSLDEQVELAERILGNLGLTRGFARLVVFCGHFSQTNNNPLAAGLDCGACGGHSGAPNARLLALMLNRTAVRAGLCQRGIVIPPETHFLAAAHNTTTDAIQFFEVADVPESHGADFEALQQSCRQASKAVALERLPQLDAQNLRDGLRRAADWSEVRPEWGLAGNVAFVIGPRRLTRDLDLSGQVFMHSYEVDHDPSGSILETIMTAPMIVTNWINMQYYASTVDNQHFGSGSKAIHNVVGRFGILSGNSGDLKTGLPLQSLHDGQGYRHTPLRLLVVIVAPRQSIQRVYQKHELVANLVNNQWLSVVALENERFYRLGTDGRWLTL